MKKINPLDWTLLAWKWANKYRGKAEEEDLFQQAMIGVILAADTYREESTFQGWASLHIRREIQRMLYTDATKGTERYHLESASVTEGGIEIVGVTKEEHGDLYVEEFIELLPVDDREKEFFKDMIEHGSVVAGKRYMERTRMTRQGMGLQRKKLVSIAEKMYAV